MKTLAHIVEQVGVDTAQLVDGSAASLFPDAAYSSYCALIANPHSQPAGFTTCPRRRDVYPVLSAADGGGLTLPFDKALDTVPYQAIAQELGSDDRVSIAERQRPTLA